ncbi:MAG TPA: DMT family transporter [Xanthobacteraceae bacterium]|nr:DMT family transporter [Xanthobacteraceae bacterium]
MNANKAAGAAPLRSIFFMMIACACLAANDTSTKIAVQSLPVPEIIAIRAGTAVVLSLVLVLIVHGARQLKTLANWKLFWRSLLEASVGPIVITCYAFLPLATVTAVMQVGPFLGMIAGIYLYKESVGWRRWLAAFFAFAGVLLIVKPGGESFQPLAFIVILTAAFGVARDIQSRRIGGEVPTFVVPLGMGIVGIALSLILTPLMRPFGLRAWEPWRWPDLHSFTACVAAGCFMVLASTFIFLAFQRGNMAVISPFRYFYLFFAVIGGIVVFGEIPDWLSLTGMTMIVAAGLYLLHRERARAKNQLAAAITPSSE